MSEKSSNSFARNAFYAILIFIVSLFITAWVLPYIAKYEPNIINFLVTYLGFNQETAKELFSVKAISKYVQLLIVLLILLFGFRRNRPIEPPKIYDRAREEEIKEKVAEERIDQLSRNSKLITYNTIRLYEKADIKKAYFVKNDHNAFECCANDIYDSALNSKTLDINGIAQYEFIGRYFDRIKEIKDNSKILKSEEVFLKILRENPTINVRVLLMDPDNPKTDKYIEERIKEVGDFEKYPDSKAYKAEIRATSKFIDELEKQGYHIKYRYYDVRHIFRYLITDESLFLSQYVKDYHGHEAMVFRYRVSPTSMYYSYQELFSQRWDRFK